MAISEQVAEHVKTLLSEKKRQRNESIRQALRVIMGALEITNVELSLALGLFVPARGNGGLSTANAWAIGKASPSEKHFRILQLLESGKLGLRLIGKDGRRNLFRVEMSSCPMCDRVLFEDRKYCCHESHRSWDPALLYCVKSEHEFETTISWRLVQNELDEDTARVTNLATPVSCSDIRVELWHLRRFSNCFTESAVRKIERAVKSCHGNKALFRIKKNVLAETPPKWAIEEAESRLNDSHL